MHALIVVFTSPPRTGATLTEAPWQCPRSAQPSPVRRQPRDSRTGDILSADRAAAGIGSYGNIRIAGADGQATTSLVAFTLAVPASAR